MNQDPKAQLLHRLENKTAVIGIVGLGYVGLPLLLRYVEAGYRVLGLDIDQEKIDKLRQGQTYIKHLPAAAIAAAQHGFEVTADFSWARINTRFIELAGEVNSNMPQWVVSKVADALNDRCKSIKGSKILVLGIAYKKNIDDMRESPAVQIMELLQEKGADIAYADPHVPVFPKMRKHHFNLASVTVSPESIARHDCIVVATHHDAFDWALIKRHAHLIVDTRGCIWNRPPTL